MFLPRACCVFWVEKCHLFRPIKGRVVWPVMCFLFWPEKCRVFLAREVHRVMKCRAFCQGSAACYGMESTAVWPGKCLVV